MSSELEIGLFSILTGTSPQTAAGDRVYPVTVQDPTFPYIRYQRITTQRNQALTGNVGVTDATLQIDSVAESYSEAKTLADSVRVLLHGYSGAWGTLACRLATLDDENDNEYRDGDRAIYSVIQRFRIHTNMD